MFKKFRLPLLLVLASVLTVLSPNTASARDHGREHRRHHSRFSFSVGVGPRYVPAPGYMNGYFDRWGYWHPYGYYDAWGYWHPR